MKTWRTMAESRVAIGSATVVPIMNRLKAITARRPQWASRTLINAGFFGALLFAQSQTGSGALELTIVDDLSGQPTPARVELLDADRKALRVVNTRSAAWQGVTEGLGPLAWRRAGLPTYIDAMGIEPGRCALPAETRRPAHAWLH